MLHRRLHDGQPDAGAADAVALGAQAVEGLEQVLQLHAQLLGRGLHGHQTFEQAAGQQAGVFGEEAEHTLRQEVAGHAGAAGTGG